MGKRRVAVSIDLFLNLFTTGYEVGFDGYGLRCLEGVPETAKLERSYFDQERGIEYLVFCDDSWEGPEAGKIIPEIYITWQKERLPDVVPIDAS